MHIISSGAPILSAQLYMMNKQLPTQKIKPILPSTNCQKPATTLMVVMINFQRWPRGDESVYWLFHHRLGKRCIMRSYCLRRARCRDSEKNVKLVMAAHPASE